MKKTLKNKEYYIALLLLILTVIFWGYSFISTKIILSELPPVSIAFFRQIIAALILLPWLGFKKSLTGITLKNFGLITLSAFFGIVLYFIFENVGLKFTSASNASMIVAAVPVFTLIAEALFFKFKINLRMIFCIILSILGVYLVITINGKLDFSSDSFRGNMLVIGAMIAWVAYTMLNKNLCEQYPSILITAYQMLSSIFLFIPFIIPEIKYWKVLSLAPLLNLVYLGVFCSALAYFFYIYASRRLGSTVSAAFLNLIPVVSVIFGFLVLGEKIFFIQVVGMGFIILSLSILNSRK